MHEPFAKYLVTRRSATQPTRTYTMPSDTAKAGWGAKFQVYAAIELFIWMPGLYATCYALQPTRRLMSTRFGQSSVERMSNCLQRYTPSYHQTLTRLSERIYGAPSVRAFAEWTLLMKVLAPVAFPIKMFIAHKIVEGHGHHHEAPEKRRRGVPHDEVPDEPPAEGGEKPPPVVSPPPPSPPPPSPVGEGAAQKPRHSKHAHEHTHAHHSDLQDLLQRITHLPRLSHATTHDAVEDTRRARTVPE